MNRADPARLGGPPDGAPNPLRRLLRWASALVLLGLMAGAGHQMLRWEPSYLPVRVVSVAGELQRLSAERLQETLIEHLRGGIVTQDLAELKEAVEALPWVSTASLRRMWPDRIELTVKEHVPLARWGEDGLVSTEGVVFRPPAAEIPSRLPLLTAADARAPELAQRLQEWRPLLAGLGLGIERIGLDARGAWAMHVDAGFELALGKLQVEARMSRFVSAWPSLARTGRLALVDMRYANGLAVTWDLERQESPGPKAQAATRPRSAAFANIGLIDAGTGGPDAGPQSRSLSRPAAHGPRPTPLVQAIDAWSHRS